MKLKVINIKAVKLYFSDIILFKPHIIIEINKIDGLIQLLINKNYEIYEESIK